MKQKNKSSRQEDISIEPKEGKAEKSRLEKFLDVAILVLIASIAFLSFRIFTNSDYFESLRSGALKNFALLRGDKESESLTVSKSVSTNRKYPDYLKDEEKVALRPQSNNDSPEDGRNWSELVGKLATTSNRLTLKKFGDDCFGEPVVLKQFHGQKVELVNDNDVEITLGYGEKSWRVPAKDRLSVSFEIATPLDNGQINVLGYGCGNSNEPSGLVLIEPK